MSMFCVRENAYLILPSVFYVKGNAYLISTSRKCIAPGRGCIKINILFLHGHILWVITKTHLFK